MDSRTPRDETARRHVDVLIVGAGLSGIGAAHRLAEMAPQRTFAIVDARERVGGTWDLFRYPGIRSDSDMYTLSFPFKPWTNAKAIADGADIRDYLEATADEFGISEAIHFGRTVTTAEWDTPTATWTTTVDLADGKSETWTSNFLYLCTGYYRYDEGFTPDFAGIDDFGGTIIHPQHWPEDLDYSGQNVVVVGSGATAVTLIPSMADQTSHITMLQRSPTYILSQPASDPISNVARKVLPDRLVHWVARKRYAVMTVGFYLFCRAFPRLARTILLRLARASTPADFDAKHLTPRYMPWDQRLCVVPGGDLWRVVREGKASIVTDHIDRFTPTGIQLTSGEHLDADLIVTATGLNVQSFGGIDLRVDGRKISPPDVFSYKGVMFSGVPNLAWILGYTNASWTLRADMSWKYVARFLNHLDLHGRAWGMPDPAGDGEATASVFDLDAGYLQRAVEHLPKAGTRLPWKVRQNWFLDTLDARRTDLDEEMVWGPPAHTVDRAVDRAV